MLLCASDTISSYTSDISNLKSRLISWNWIISKFKQPATQSLDRSLCNSNSRSSQKYIFSHTDTSVRMCACALALTIARDFSNWNKFSVDFLGKTKCDLSVCRFVCCCCRYCCWWFEKEINKVNLYRSISGLIYLS